MNTERFWWLAALIAAHPGGKLIGRTRLQKEMRLLQRLGLPSDYDFKMHHYGPYSDGIQADVNLLECFGMISEEVQFNHEGNAYSIFSIKSLSGLPDVARFKDAIDLMSRTDTTVLELAATYDAYREAGLNHERAIDALRAKKGSKCDQGRAGQAIQLLNSLGLSY